MVMSRRFFMTASSTTCSRSRILVMLLLKSSVMLMTTVRTSSRSFWRTMFCITSPAFSHMTLACFCATSCRICSVIWSTTASISDANASPLKFWKSSSSDSSLVVMSRVLKRARRSALAGTMPCQPRNGGIPTKSFG
jgi:hypothetical protein